MGGHGGLNILPQKRWNVYNFDNREKVRKDEEAAARDEQLKREQSRKRDTELRLEHLRTARGLASLKRPSPEPVVDAAAAAVEPVESEPKTGHINLFEGIKIFDVVQVPKNDGNAEEEDKGRKRMRKEAASAARLAAREAEARAFDPEDEKYRLGYGIAGKGVKLPWYLERRNGEGIDHGEDCDDGLRGGKRGVRQKKSGKKSLQELREERLKREKREKERERALFMEQSRRSGGFSRRR